MIQEIKIQNFQSHKNTKIVFDKGVNIITGTTDCGKSAVIRALKWIVYNKPRGDAFRSFWGGKTMSTIKFTDGTKITREKDKENKYILTKNGIDTTFKALGNDIPSEISSYLNMDEINLQQQADASFLISKTPGEVALHFNRIAKLSQINSSLKAIQSWIRSLEHTISANKQNFESYKESLTWYDFLPGAELSIKELEDCELRFDDAVEKSNQIQSLIIDVTNIQNRIKKVSKITKAKPLILEIEKLIIKKRQTNARKNAIQKNIDSINGIHYLLTKHQKIIKAKSLFLEIIALFKKLEKEQIKLLSISLIIRKFKSRDFDLTATNQKLKELQIIFKKEFPNICPLCGTKIN